jgi:hypothetical protein
MLVALNSPRFCSIEVGVFDNTVFRPTPTVGAMEHQSMRFRIKSPKSALYHTVNDEIGDIAWLGSITSINSRTIRYY